MSLRKHLEIAGIAVRVFELLPPLVDTDMTTELNEKKMSSKEVTTILVRAIRKDLYTIRVGATKLLYMMNRFFSAKAFNLLNKPRTFGLLK